MEDSDGELQLILEGIIGESGTISGKFTLQGRPNSGDFEFVPEMNSSTSAFTCSGSLTVEGRPPQDMAITVVGSGSSGDDSNKKSARYSFAKALARFYLLTAFDSMAGGGFVDT